MLATVAIRRGTRGLYAISKFWIKVSAVLEGAGSPDYTMFDRHIKTWIFFTLGLRGTRKQSSVPKRQSQHRQLFQFTGSLRLEFHRGCAKQSACNSSHAMSFLIPGTGKAPCVSEEKDLDSATLPPPTVRISNLSRAPWNPCRVFLKSLKIDSKVSNPLKRNRTDTSANTVGPDTQSWSPP